MWQFIATLLQLPRRAQAKKARSVPQQRTALSRYDGLLLKEIFSHAQPAYALSPGGFHLIEPAT